MAQQRIPSLSPSPIAFAHRGARAHARENTLEAFLLAVRLGANGMETDAWLTSDGHVVLDHDGVVRMRGRRRPIQEVTRAQLPAHIPTLEEYFDRVGLVHHLSVDVKDDAVTDVMVQVARVHAFPLDRLWICHHRHEEVLSIRARHADVRVVDSTRLGRVKEGLEARAAKDSTAGVDAINMHHTEWNGGSTTLVHRFGLFAFGWDVQFDHQLETAWAMGLDAVYSDHVDTMVDAYVAHCGVTPSLG